LGCGAGTVASGASVKEIGAVYLAAKTPSQAVALACAPLRRGLSWIAAPEGRCTTWTTRLPEAPARPRMVNVSRRLAEAGLLLLKRAKTASLSSMGARMLGTR
jgi:hypothetical protein